MSEQEVFDVLKYRIEIDTRGTRWYYNNANQLHRTDGPAVECEYGRNYWYQNNQRHRTDGPAVEYHNGGKEWWQNNRRHRIDGPAIEYKSGHKEWWINGKFLSEDEFNQLVSENV